LSAAGATDDGGNVTDNGTDDVTEPEGAKP
jgi:hypothetical protein